MILLAALLAFQCPDGSPPPCARATTRSAAPNSVAVLYFENLSRDSADAYLADGLTEEIISRLGDVPRLSVKSRFEVGQVKGRVAGDPVALGRTLGAAWLLTGSVQRGGTRVRVRVELIRAASRQRVWGDTFDQPDGDVLAIEDAIGQGVVRGIAGALLPEERAALERRPTRNQAAYDLYLRGKASFNRNEDSSAIAQLTMAVREDSTFADAWAALALTWDESADSWYAPLEAYPQARTAAHRALALDSSNATALVALAEAAQALDHDAAASEALARRAIALAPRMPEAAVVLNFALVAQGRASDALASVLRAWQLDTLSAYTNTYVALTFMLMGRTAESRSYLQRTGSMESLTAALAYDTTVHVDSALVALLRRQWRYGAGWPSRSLIIALHKVGDDALARTYLDSMIGERQRERWFNPYPIASAYATLGDREQSLAWLQRAYDERTIWIEDTVYSHVFDAMRADPRFIDLMRRSNLPLARVN